MENRCTHLWKFGPDGDCWASTHQILKSFWKSHLKPLKLFPSAFMRSERFPIIKDSFFFFFFFTSCLQCTVTCGGGVQTRSVQCLRQGRPASGCLPHQKPAVLRACNTNFCPAPVKRGKTQLYMLQQGWLLISIYRDILYIQ